METAAEEGQPQDEELWLARPVRLEGLLRCVREYAGNVEPAALAKLTALPQHHAMQNLDVRGTDQAQADDQSKQLVPKALKESGAGDQPPRSSEPALS